MPIDAKLAQICAENLTNNYFVAPSFTGIGTFFTSATDNANQIQRTWEELCRTQQLVANVLLAAATAQLDLDYIWEQARTFGDESEVTTGLLRSIQAMGEALDVACAQQIDALCTAPHIAPKRHFADFDELSIDTIHELNVSPELEQLVGNDGKILESEDGHLVVAYGDLEQSPHVTTIVAGVGSSNPNNWPDYIERGRTIAQHSGAAVVWLGYSAPESIPAALAAEPARAGADDLREFQAALARRNPEQYRSVVAHSYGAVVAGQAARLGIDADALIFVGSPGVGAAHASELQLRSEQPRIIAVTGDRDPITFTAAATDGVHGPDPTHPHFGAEVWQSANDHTGYWDDPNFLREVAALP